MIYKTRYKVETGEILSVISGQEGFIEFPEIEGCLYVDGRGDRNTQHVVNGEIVDKPQSELDANALEEAWLIFRQDRNHRLKSCDWTQVSDAPVDQAAWATYRQALRDLPSQVTDPTDVTWPTAPST